jgi:hypothetical protein
VVGLVVGVPFSRGRVVGILVDSEVGACVGILVGGIVGASVRRGVGRTLVGLIVLGNRLLGAGVEGRLVGKVVNGAEVGRVVG